MATKFHYGAKKKAPRLIRENEGGQSVRQTKVRSASSRARGPSFPTFNYYHFLCRKRAFFPSPTRPSPRHTNANKTSRNIVPQRVIVSRERLTFFSESIRIIIMSLPQRFIASAVRPAVVARRRDDANGSDGRRSIKENETVLKL